MENSILLPRILSVLSAVWEAYTAILHSYFVLFAQFTTAENDAVLDTKAMAEHLLDAYGNSILRLAYSYVHNTADAEEIVQDTLVQFLKAAPAFVSVSHEKAWCLRVAGNLAKNRIKYNRLRDTDELNEELVEEKQEDLSFVWETVKSLPVKYREVVHLFYYEGYTTAQIAQILHMNESTVRSNLSRGRTQLKTILKEEYDFDD